MIYDVIIVGAGASGLTAAAFLTKQGRNTLVLEKEHNYGGLVNTFTRDGFTFDGGIRALENAGALFPMLKKLGIEIDLIKNRVSLGIEDQIIFVDSYENLNDYEAMLIGLYPESSDEISAIIEDIKQISRFMDIQYGIDNPLFLDFNQDRDYFIKEVFPWMFKYLLTVPKVSKKNEPVISYLRKFTSNQALLDIITQHFFTNTPAYFALSYFKLYQDYFYPKTGTGTFSLKLVDFINEHGGEIRLGNAVVAIDLEKKIVKTSDGDEIQYKQLLWTADQKTLYKIIERDRLHNSELLDVINEKQKILADMSGNDSIFTLYLTVNLPKDFFEEISTGHFFYTPSRKGQSKAGQPPVGSSWDDIQQWLKDFFTLTTYEIAIPALRSPDLAPEGKTGLIISVLFDYPLAKYIYDQGWDEVFRETASKLIINTLEQSVYPGLPEAIIDYFTATPITIQKKAGTTDGAIT
ncbi:MAG: phytoene desaturase family protein, partial [Anaerolineales bacterium]